MENNSPWNIPVENTTLSICCNGNNNALIRIFMGTKLVGFVQSIKFEADMNKVHPVIEIKFPSLTGWFFQQDRLKDSAADLSKVAVLIKNVFPGAKVMIGDTEI